MIAPLSFGPVGIIDIGSNSVRLVIYGGTERVPSVLFNEKVMAGLGRGLRETGRMDEESMAMALDALARFQLIAKRIKVKRLRTVATAAVREAENGPDFLYAAAKMGLKPALISGEEEAVGAAFGVLSAIPEAKGMVADLGGGSLELAGIARGAIGAVDSLPIGVLRVGTPPDEDMISSHLERALKGMTLGKAAKGQGLYLVGGSFRAIAHLDLLSNKHPLPIAHQHQIDPARLDALEKLAEDADKSELVEKFWVPSQRAPQLPAGLAILRKLIETCEPSHVTVSAYGLREGLLYSELSDAKRQEDPLLAAALEVGRRLGRFGDHGALLDQWIAPVFTSDGKAMARLRLAACLLGDIAWNAHPDFRALRAVDQALHGNWVGVDAKGRAIIGRALFTAFGEDGEFDPQALTLLSKREIARAYAWGRAIRLAQRLSAGTDRLLRQTALKRQDDKVLLVMSEKKYRLYGLAVQKRHEQLAAALKLKAAVAFE
ncbi:Ppx/GppA family phosphatase [Sphingomicrobium sediminis]|uniref:Ppx/GppA family phosphatase n=1 Tax=Sphingomicrobium sediminis TaxID=2950949 RepID=A0A9X2EGH9_9SPHN|nr:Ppx/GppA family phosphatase [Sphingomicrobium sediminis]MCM8556956.1 Ppx/GppA family phosphatase [Sphingomicrobium sediminis]